MTDAPAHFVLVHGAWHGAWCWDRLTPVLRAKGHEVVAVDLPGRDDPAKAAAATLDDFVATVTEQVLTAPEPVVLVGHSMGGMTVTRVAAEIPDRIAALVYVAGFVPGSGQSLAELASMPSFASSLAARGQDVDPTQGLTRMSTEYARQAFYGSSPADLADDAVGRLVPEGLAASIQPAVYDDGALRRVRRVYIEATEDAAVPLDAQRVMHRAAGIDDVRILRSDHSPFMSCPEDFADVLHAVVR